MSFLIFLQDFLKNIPNCLFTVVSHIIADTRKPYFLSKTSSLPILKLFPRKMSSSFHIEGIHFSMFFLTFSCDKFENKLYSETSSCCSYACHRCIQKYFVPFYLFFQTEGEEKWHTCHEIYIFLRFSSRFSFRLFGTTRQDLYRVGCMLQFNNAIYHSPYLSMKISFNRGKSHLILFSIVVFHFSTKSTRERKKIERKLDLGSLSLQGDGIWLVIAFLFHSLFPFWERFILEKVMNFFFSPGNCFFSFARYLFTESPFIPHKYLWTRDHIKETRYLFCLIALFNI